MKVNIIQTAGNCFKVELVGMTLGKVATLKHALEKYEAEYVPHGSIVAEIRIALDNAIKQNTELSEIVK